MTDTVFGDDIIKILLVFLIGSAALIITQRSLTSLFSIYALQSGILAAIALVLFSRESTLSLLLMALLTIISKVIIIPMFLRRLLAVMPIKRDLEFRYLTPIGSIIMSAALFFVVYKAFGVFSASLDVGPLFLLGAIIGVSLALMGMLVIVSRRKVVTKIIGYLTMENGVLLFSLFIAEMPFIIEVLIVVDLLMIIVLSTVLAFGIDSSVEAFHKRLSQLGLESED
ncbi:hydrogenase-4 component E [Dehalogenimonas formicexedens]|uniref:Hydrogenase-4 component E n=1 Tax=Dehalogenimonas formicexedens TaxID=1839801 RepID=A0A1P8F9S1_9CHLR|nr:hydrogenase subunit [Dehalogenimonas formicexedens]APV45182.1 hydrogenase-4 component E [Dehalogenimonas formicexedens]